MNTQIPFIENTEQIDSQVEYYADTLYGTAHITNSSIVHSITGAYQTTNNGYYDAFIVKLDTKELHVFPGQSIQNAIDSAGSDYTIVVHGNSGSPYTYSENLTIDRSLIMHSADDGAVTISALNNNQPVINITSSGSYSTISGFIISNAIHSSGISLESANNCQILSNTISYNNVGVKLYDSPSNYIQSNSIINNGWTGICLDNSSNNTINGSNNITGNQDGIFIANNSNSNIITSNNIPNNTGMGVSILNSSNGNNVDSNNIYHNTVMGLFIQKSIMSTVSGNIIENNGWTGICFDNASGAMINANEIRGNSEGVFITNNSYGINIYTSNNIHDNTSVGISILGGSFDNSITNTTISHNGGIGIFLQNSNLNHISWNIIQENIWAGIVADNAQICLQSNTISGNQEGVFIVNNFYGNAIQQNNINYNTGVGITLINSSNSDIYGNKVADNGVSGIFIQISNETTINHNTLQNNRWAGIVLDTTTNTQVYNNNIENNPEQALAVNGTGNTFYQDTVGNYWSDWTTNNPRPIDGNENIYDQYPSTTSFLII